MPSAECLFDLHQVHLIAWGLTSFSDFFADTKKYISHYVFEVGQNLNLQQRIDNDSDNSEQKGILEFFFNSAPFNENSEYLKTFDFDIKSYTYQIFEIEHNPKKLGLSEIGIEPKLAAPYLMENISCVYSC